MGLENVYTIAGMMTGATVFRDIRSQTINPQLQAMVLGGSGTGLNTFAAVGQLNPIIDFTSGDIKRILAAMTNQIALPIDNDFYIWLQKMAQGGIRAAGATHVKGTIAKGMVIPVSLRLVDGDVQSAALTCQILLVSTDGTTSPLALAGSQTLVVSGGAAEGWTLGEVSLNGTVLEGVEEVTIEFGITPSTLGASGMPYKTFCGVLMVDPTVRITAASLDEFISTGLSGTAQGATDSTIKIQDLLEGGLRGTSPITCSIDEGLIYPDNVNLADGQHGRQSIILKPTYDGTALPLAWSGLVA